MSFITKILYFLTLFFTFSNTNPITTTQNEITHTNNNCVTFTVGSGTGCSWMCNYCATELGTNNYYFQDNVCTYQTGGCIGNPIAGKQYTCCSLSDKEL